MHTKTPPTHRVVALLATLVMALGLTAATASPAAAATGTALADLTVRETPSSSGKAAGTIKKGATVSFTCYRNGSTVTGPYGASKMWLSVNGASNRWVPEALVYTGTNAPTVPVCGSSSGSLGARVDAFVAKYNGRSVDYDGWYGAQCVDLVNQYIVEVVRGTPPRVSSAYQMYDTYDSSKFTRLSASSVPKKGDIAVWAASFPYSGGHGHVAIVLANGSSTIKVLTQNPGPTTVKNMTKSYLRGYLRPRA